jgi:imidazole glycerol-phosphate synthase subunit HisH
VTHAASGFRTVTLVDLEIQNILSVTHALQLVGANVRIAKDAQSISEADLLVLPGVGSFAEASRRLHGSGLAQAIRHHALQCSRPVVGFCLGMQLLADTSEEHGNHPGLGLIPGTVVKLKEEPPAHRVPNIGWRTVHLQAPVHPLIPADLDGSSFYHVHSYHFLPSDPSHRVGCSQFACENIASIVRSNHVVGTQFHPEKSQEPGLDLLHALISHLR